MIYPFFIICSHQMYISLPNQRVVIYATSAAIGWPIWLNSPKCYINSAYKAHSRTKNITNKNFARLTIRFFRSIINGSGLFKRSIG